MPVLAAALVVLIDQLTKWWALESLQDDRIVELVWTLQLNLVFNPGFAFGAGRGAGPIIGVVATVVAVGLLWWTAGQPSRLVRLSCGLIAGGAIGNVVDRALRRGEGFFGGYVVDFFDLQWWPVFNVADAAISVGVALLLVFSGRVVERRPRAEP